MATSKRKDAAALFELLDNSTLKVPKNAGSLKIPSWWSSKTNPSPTSHHIDDTLDDPVDEATDDAADDGTSGPISALAELSAPATRAPAAAPSAPAPDAVIETPPSDQHRLFEPPPASAASDASPSIRPPAAAPMQAPIPVAMPSARPPLTASAGRSPTRGPSMPVGPAKPVIDPTIPVAPREPKIFAPHTYAQKRKPWVTPRPGAFARMPNWVLVSGLAAIVLVFCGIIVAARSRDRAANASTNTPTVRNAPSADSLIPLPQSDVPQQPVRQALVPVPVPPANQAAHAYGPGQVDRTRDQFYVVIASTPSKAVAEKNAQFLASHGIDVSTEVDAKGIFLLVSVKGFPSTTAAKPFRDHIADLGHQTDDFKKTKKGSWDDARIQTGLKTTATR